MKKHVIYTETDDSIDSILEKISNYPKYKNPIYIMIPADIVKIFLNKTNLAIFAQWIKQCKHEVILISKNTKLFKIADEFRLTVQNVLDENLSFSNVLISKRKISKWPKTKSINYSVSNLNDKLDKLQIPDFLQNKTNTISDAYKQKKKLIFPFTIWSFFLLFLILFLILPNSKVYLEPASEKIKLTNNIIFSEITSNKKYLLENKNWNVLSYKNIEKLYEKSIVYHSKGKLFEWNHSKWIVLIENGFWESFAIKKWSKFQTEDGIIFVTNHYVWIPAWKRVIDDKWNSVFRKWQAKVWVTANDYDASHEIIWSRWNISVWTKMTIPKLWSYLLKFLDIKANNDFSWWTTKWRKVVNEDDQIASQEKLKKELFAQSEIEISKMIEEENKKNNVNYKLFWDENFFKIEIAKMKVPEDILWKKIESFTVTWAIIIKALSYDFDKLYSILEKNMKQKAHPNMKLSYIDIENLQIRAFDVDKNLNRIKAAVTLYWREDYDLFWDENFSKMFIVNNKNKLTNLSPKTAEKYLRNLPEVSNVKIKLWPPFIKKLPKMPGSIDILEMN